MDQHLKTVFKQPGQTAAPDTFSQGFSCLSPRDVPTSEGLECVHMARAASKAVPTSALPSSRCEKPSHAGGELQTEMCQALLYLLQSQHSWWRGVESRGGNNTVVEITEM